MAALINASTGYDSIADFTDTTPQPDSSTAGAVLWDRNIVSFLWDTFALREAVLLTDCEAGGGGGASEAWGIIGT